MSEPVINIDIAFDFCYTKLDRDRFVMFQYAIDNTKPRCWVEGTEYKFNKTLISSRVFRTMLKH